ncbi:hypothetical protein NHX12_023371 [Muraenolepis orangiensis]|uniref:Uncharacterized protein n=1 Tax=Muraenolepis orangiensis TaxID=630683 RepID=A0A9Q0EKY9_9TELE|nr:hypothetical protein NHX12_023371 [Muraenolepis orangiensis]
MSSRLRCINFITGLPPPLEPDRAGIATAENTVALPTNPAPLTKDTQATSTHNLRPGDLSTAEGNDQSSHHHHHIHSTVDSSETHHHNSQVNSPTAPDSETRDWGRVTPDSPTDRMSSSVRVDTSTVEVAAFTATDADVPVQSHTDESLGDHLLSTTRSTMQSKVKTCGAFSCVGVACYKNMTATEICQEGRSYCELRRSVTQVTWNRYVTVWTAGCAQRCGPGESCSPFSSYRCRQQCCKACPVSCLRLGGTDAGVGTATPRLYAPLMLALMCITSQLIGRLLS